MKKTLSLVLAAAMLLSMSVCAFAEDTQMEVTYNVAEDYTVTIPDSGNVDSETGTVELPIAVTAGSVIKGDNNLKISVNAGLNYDDSGKSYRMRNDNSGSYVTYELNYKSAPVNPQSSTGTAVLEELDAETVFTGVSNNISVTVGDTHIAGTYRDTLTFTFETVAA